MLAQRMEGITRDRSQCLWTPRIGPARVARYRSTQHVRLRGINAVRMTLPKRGEKQDMAMPKNDPHALHVEVGYDAYLMHGVYPMDLAQSGVAVGHDAAR